MKITSHSRMQMEIITIRRRSGSENIHLTTGQPRTRRRTRRSSWRIRRVSSILPTSGWQWSHERLLVYWWTLHLPSSRRTKSQTPCAERRIIPNSATEYRCDQGNKYDLKCVGGKPYQRLLEHWWGPRSVTGVDRVHTVHNIDWKTSRRVFMVRVTADKDANIIETRSFVTRIVVKDVKSSSTKRKARMGNRKTEARQCKKVEKHLLYRSGWCWFQKTICWKQKAGRKSWRCRWKQQCLVKSGKPSARKLASGLKLRSQSMHAS